MDEVCAKGAFEEAIQAGGSERWRDALLAIAVLAAGRGAIGGLWLTARAGGVRDAFLEHIVNKFGAGIALRRLPPGAGSDALLARLDLAATAQCRRPVFDEGLLAAVRGGLLVVPMAERLDGGAAATLAENMENALFTVLALDEAAETEEVPPGALTERLALHVSLDGIPLSALRSAEMSASPVLRGDWRRIPISDSLLEQMLALALAAGHRSVRTHLQLVATSRILVALAGRRRVRPEDVAAALRLCLGIRLLATESMPPPTNKGASPDPPATAADQPPPPQALDGAEAAATKSTAEPADPLSLLEAAVAKGAIDGLSLVVSERAARQATRSGKAGAEMRKARRGRPYATASTAPFADARPDLMATLRAAAPWQRLRQAASASRDPSEAAEEKAPGSPSLRKSDFRYHRRRHASPATAIFVVDASGSTALDRLGETKGAIEQLLTRCYVRRDEVALIAFRAEGADLLLPPTRSLAAAKRRLAALPGGGPTPLAAGLKKGLELALATRRRGNTPLVVVLTDGAGNVALDGKADRALAARQAEDIARHYRSEGLTTICVDIARRPRPAVAALAGHLGAELHVLRQSAAAGLSALVNTAMTGARP